MKPLTPLHSSLIQSKLDVFHKMSTDDLRRMLAPGQEHCLKARPDGTILDGHHRIHVLRTRGEDVDSLPREVVQKTFSEFREEMHGSTSIQKPKALPKRKR
jgi:hypothetical protein